MPTHYAGTPEETLALDTFIKLTRATNAFESRLYQQGAIGDLTPSQFGILETLFHLGPLCQGELSEKLLKSTGNVTLVLDNLEKRDLVKRVREVVDRRMVRVHLTPTGEVLIRRVFPLMVKAIVAELAILTPQEQVTLGDILRKLGKFNSTAEALRPAD